MSEDTQKYMKEARICVIVPTFNNAGTIADVVNRVLSYTDNVIVVNDGCTDDTSERLAPLLVKGVTMLSNDTNQGKGKALMKGLKWALRQGFHYAITLDADGQHYPEDIPTLLNCHKQHSDALIVGERSLDSNQMRRGSSFANKFSNFWYNFQTGLHLNDTQSGYRLYPLRRLNARWPITSRYESELELLVYYSWADTEVVGTDIRVYYPPKEERVSSFRPVYDFMRITLLNTILTLIAIVYVKPRKWFKKLRHE